MSTASRKRTIFLDSNILYSALSPDTEIRHLLGALLWDEHQLLASPYVFGEVRRNAEGRKLLIEELARFTTNITLIPDAPLLHRIPLAQTDRPILAAALASGAEFLLTGNKRDFRHLYGTSIEGTAIVSPRQIADILLQRG